MAEFGQRCSAGDTCFNTVGSFVCTRFTTLQPGFGFHSSLGFLAQDYPVVAFTGVNSDTNAPLYLETCGDALCAATMATGFATLDSNAGAARYLAMAQRDEFNRLLPVVGYSALDTLSVAVCVDVSCTNVRSFALFQADVGDVVDVDTKVDATNRPVFVFTYDYSSASRDMLLVRCKAADCSTSPPAPYQIAVIAQGFQPSLTFGSNGYPVVSFRSTANTLNLLVCGSSDCSTLSNVYTVDPASDGHSVGHYSCVRIAPSTNNPVIAHQDLTTQQLLLRVCSNPTCSQSASSFVAFMGATGYPISMELSRKTGFPVIAYIYSGPSIRVVVCGNLLCSKGQDFLLGNGVAPSLRLTSEDLATVSFFDIDHNRLTLWSQYLPGANATRAQ